MASSSSHLECRELRHHLDGISLPSHFTSSSNNGAEGTWKITSSDPTPAPLSLSLPPWSPSPNYERSLFPTSPEMHQAQHNPYAPKRLPYPLTPLPNALTTSVPRIRRKLHSFNSIQFSSIQFNSIQFNSIQFHSIQFHSIQFNSVQLTSRNPSDPISYHLIKASSRTATSRLQYLRTDPDPNPPTATCKLAKEIPPSARLEKM